MVTHLEPQAPKKEKKMRRAQNPVKHGSFLAAGGVGGRGPRLLSPTERRETPYGYATARGPLAGLELYGVARPTPPTLRPRAPENTKNLSLLLGRAFWTESGSLISVSTFHLLKVPKIGKTCRFDTFCGGFFTFQD